jgi:hypothetical protein
MGYKVTIAPVMEGEGPTLLEHPDCHHVEFTNSGAVVFLREDRQLIACYNVDLWLTVQEMPAATAARECPARSAAARSKEHA